jgi:MoaA/NifB/PqqE/SkfB family radical SAM enzyme
MYADIDAVVRRASERGVMTTVSTNGTLLEDRADELVAGGLKFCSVSLLGPPEIHNETVCMPDAFERLRRGVHAVEEARRRRKSATPVVVINCPITDLNAGRLVEMADLVDDWPAKVLHFQHMWFKPAEAVALQERCHGGLLDEGAFAEMGDADESTVDVAALSDEIDALLERSGKRPILLYPRLGREAIRPYYHEPLKPLGPKAAHCLWLFTMVHPNGEVQPCEGFNAGDLNGQSLMDIWNGERLRGFRKHLLEVGRLPVCARCCVLFRRH